MPDTGFLDFKDPSGGGLRGWIVRQLSELRDRMKHDIAVSDERLASVTAQAERHIKEAERALESSGRP